MFSTPERFYLVPAQSSHPSRERSDAPSTATTRKPPFLEVLDDILRMYSQGKSIGYITGSLSHLKLKDVLNVRYEFFTTDFIGKVVGGNLAIFTRILDMHKYGFNADYIRDYLRLEKVFVRRDLIVDTIFYLEQWDNVSF